MSAAPPAYNVAVAAKQPTPSAAATAVAAPPTPTNTSVTFTVNDVSYTVPSTDIASTYPLLRFIRERTPFRGVKVGCNGEAGCGACTVTVSEIDPSTGKPSTRAMHSCVRPVMACDGSTIITNDGLTHSGNEVAAKIQKVMAESNLSQCGMCSCGFASTMYALLCRNPKPSKLEIEREFDGNLCRCTGYANLSALHTFAGSGEDAPQCVKDNCCKKRGLSVEIEDAAAGAVTAAASTGADPTDDEVVHFDKSSNKASVMKLVRPKISNNHNKQEPQEKSKAVVKTNNDGVAWIDCATLADLNYYLPWYSSLGKPVILAVAQTSQAVLKQEAPTKLFIGRIPELNTITSSASGVAIGASVPIARAISFLETVQGPAAKWQTKHFPQAALHLHRVASQLLRNVACLTGNLFLAKHSHAQGKDFQSDVCTVLFGLGATLACYDAVAQKPFTVSSIDDFFSTDFTGKYVRSINVPWAKSDSEWYRSYKVAMRRVNSHAYVNAAMRVTFDAVSGVISNSTVIFGGVFGRDAEVPTLEAALNGATVTSNAGAQAVLAKAQSILVPTNAPNDVPMTSEMKAYVARVAVGYVYKLLLSLQPSLDTELVAATKCWLKRDVPSTAKQIYNGSDPAEAPVNAPMPKMHAINQTNGTAVYTGDLPKPGQDTLFGSLVLAEVACADIVSIDSTAAAKVAGFVQFVDASVFKSDPKANAWANGQIFASTKTAYAGQPVGICLATSEFAAKQAADAVKITLGAPPKGGPVLTIRDSIKAGRLIPHQPGMPPFSVNKGDAQAVIDKTDKAHTYEGEVEMGWQYHFHLEGHEATVIPREGRYEVYSATQMPNAIQGVVAGVFGVPMSKVLVEGRRCGGGYGGKITNSQLPAIIAATACKAAGGVRPVSLAVHMPEYFRALGARSSRLMKYTVCWADDGTITAFKATVYCGCGVAPTDEVGGAFVTVQSLDNCYNIANFAAEAQLAGTDTPAVNACRGPGWVPAVMLIEAAVSQVAACAKLPRDVVRAKNFYHKGDTTPGGMVLRYYTGNEIWQQLQSTAQYVKRRGEVEAWNKGNYFVKKGLAMTPVRFSVGQTGANFNALVSVYQDGTVDITTGGSEIGQGLNVKVAQAASYRLGLTGDEMEKMVQVLPCSTRVLSAPSNVTGGSVTSELCCLAVMHACDELNRRLAPYRTTGKGQTWAQLVGAAAMAGADLTATGFTHAPVAAQPFNYCSYGAACVETLVDTLTGEFLISRVDLLFDAGRSLNPMIDMGQIEGGFMFGCGYEAFEEVTYNSVTGKPLNATTWEYKPPSAYDLPGVWNTTLLANAPNPLGVLGSKATGEPGVCLGSALVQSLEAAVEAQLQQTQGASARFAAQITPFNVLRVQSSSSIQVKDMIVQTPKA